MKKIFCLICLALVLWGCGFNQRPAWVIESTKLFEIYKNNFLTKGQTNITESNFQRSVEEIKKSGDLDLLEKAWLTRMALQVAVLKEIEENDYRKIAIVKPVPANENFFIFLAGDIATVDKKLLPTQYRHFLDAIKAGDLTKTAKTISSMKEEPVSQLVAAGIALRRHLESEAIIQAAVETASINGWKTALLAWLERLAAFQESAGQTAKAADVRSRIDLIKQ